VLIQVGIHPVENLLHLLGPAVNVSARFRFDTLGPDMPDAAAVTIEHRSGALSLVSTSWTTPGHFSMELLGTGGNLAYRLDHGHWPDADVDDHGELVLDLPGSRPEPYPVETGDPLGIQVTELAHAVSGGRMQVDVAAGLRAMAVVIASVRSARSGGAPVDIADLFDAAGANHNEIDELVNKTKETP
jgi:predicted dehydrogenase